MISATVIADSVSPTGHRVTTLETNYPRFIHAQVMTHRVFSRNGASSRAIPVERMLDRVKQDPVRPVAWPREQRGMQGGPELDGDDLAAAQRLWNRVGRDVIDNIDAYLGRHPDKATRLHKSVVNRLMEPFGWMRLIITATDWEGFWRQRAGNAEGYTDAQAEIHTLADLMLDAYQASDPVALDYGNWHLPYVDEQTVDDVLTYNGGYDVGAIELLKDISTARCARVSLLTHDGRRAIEDDLRLARKRLAVASPPHASPYEHVATPAKPPRRVRIDDVVYTADVDRPKGNLAPGWRQYRHDLWPNR